MSTTSLWFILLYQPLFNALILIYSNLANFNLGWAVVWLTVGLRVLLLPLTIVSERNALRHNRAVAEADEVIKAFKNDPLAQKAAARKVMKKYKISPWAKVLVLAVQAVVLVLLYQVFIRGVSGERIIRILYPAVEYPGRINTDWYGFDIGARHQSLWAGVVAFYLFISIYVSNSQRPAWQKSDLSYLVLFPLATFAALWYLPMVKSLFILTTMLFSDTIHGIRLIFFGRRKTASAGSAAQH